MEAANKKIVVGAPKETFAGERRVAITPAAASAITKAGADVVIQRGAGASAGFTDAAYMEAGARLVETREAVFQQATVVALVRLLGADPAAQDATLRLVRREQTLIAFMDPLGSAKAMQQAAGTGATFFAMELVPRITRAQPMDALSSQATVSGYKAVLMAADVLPRMFPMLMTAAGTITPAKVLINGAGVAGLQAISVAKRLGALVRAYDVRPVVKEQVESLGAKFVELPLETKGSETSGGYAKAMDEAFYRKQKELLASVIADSDVVITTAAVPGKRAPILITAEMVKAMRPGSVIVDVAAERGGNCELTKPGETVTSGGVTIIGHANIPSTVPYDASQMYAKNVVNLLGLMLKKGEFTVNLEDQVIKDTMAARGGEITHPMVREVLGQQPVAAKA